MKNFLINTFLITISTTIVLLLSEGALFVFGYEPHYNNLYSQSSKLVSLKSQFCSIGTMEEAISNGLIKGPLGNLKYDAEFGYTTFEEPHGFNDKKNFFDNFENFKRVIVLGDSFTRGASAETGYGYVDLLNNYYNNNGVLFFNTGVGGYGQNNEFAILQKYVDIVKPHTVILAFYTGNDFWDNLSPVDRWSAFGGVWIKNYEVIFKGESFSVTRRGEGEIFNAYKTHIGCELPVNNLKDFLRERIAYKTRIGTQAWLVISSFNRQIESPKQSKKQPKRDYVYNPDAMSPLRYSNTKQYIVDIREFLNKRSIPFYIIVVPDRISSTEFLTKSRDYKAAISLFRELDLNYIEIFDELNLLDYVDIKVNPGDGHWNNSGHEKMFHKLVERFGKTFEYENAFGARSGRVPQNPAHREYQNHIR